MPNVTNMTVVEAQKLLEEKEFKVELEENTAILISLNPVLLVEQVSEGWRKRKQGSLLS